MPTFPNQPLKIAFSLSSLPKITSQNCFSKLCLHLLLSTLPAVSFSKNSNILISEIQPHNPKCSYNSLIKIFTESNRFLQSLLLFKKAHFLSKPDLFVFPSVLKSCSYLSYEKGGICVHGYLTKCGFINWVGVGNSLILMYMKFGQAQNACRVFEEMPIWNGDVFCSLVYGFSMNEFYEEVVSTFEWMVELCIFMRLDTVYRVIMACREMGSLEKGILVHDFVIHNGFDKHVLVSNSLISMYVRMGRIDLGHRVFIDMYDRDIVSWNSLITGYAQSGNWEEVFDIFSCMKKNGKFVLNAVTLLGLLSACGQAWNLDLGMSIHGNLIRAGLLPDFRLGTAIVDMYAKCARIDCARTVFQEDLLEKTLVSWNSLIAGYSQNGYDQEATMLYEQMITKPYMKPDSVTFSNVVLGYASQGNLGRIQAIHALIIKKALDMDGDVVLGTAMINAYGKCLDIKATKLLFTCITRPCTAIWNALIAIYNLNQQAEQAMVLFIEMLQSKVLPDTITMIMLFQSSGELGNLKLGNMVHGFCLLKGFSSDLVVGNAMIYMYMRCGSVKSSEVLFSSLSEKNIITWNTMMCSYIKFGFAARALRVFCQMQSEKQYTPNSVTMISFVQASAAVFASRGAELSHAYILKLGLASEVLVVNSLIDAYAKNGLIANAKSLFMQTGHLRDLSSWNAMIAGYGMNGQGREACNLLSEMEEDGYEPNSVTFISLLSSCSHSGMIEEGCRIFDIMFKKYQIQPGMEHWTCIVDMFGRAGRLEEAYQIIKHGLYQNSDNHVQLYCNAAWGALLNACRMNLNMELGKLAGEKLSKLEPDNCGYHSLLSNLYASSTRWAEATKIRKVFEDGRLVKKAGLSVFKH